MTLIKDLDGHAEIAIDTAVMSVSRAIALISEKVDIKDISVIGESIDETVVSLYKEFKI
jgi:ABC-2 type transport system ATP-binding protein